MADDFEYFSRLGRGESGALRVDCSAAAAAVRARSPPQRSVSGGGGGGSGAEPGQRRALSARQHRSQDDNKSSGSSSVSGVGGSGGGSSSSSSGGREARLLSRQRTRSVTGGTSPYRSPSHDDNEEPAPAVTSPERDYLTVRHFETYGKDVQNKGDSLKAAHSSSSLNRIGVRGGVDDGGGAGETGDHSDDDEVWRGGGGGGGGSSRGGGGGNAALSHRTSASSDRSSSVDEFSVVHRILLLGGSGVGKTSLTQQFLTSKDIKDEDIDDDGAEKFVTILLDGKESTVIFMDSDYDKNSYDPSSATAYIVVYSVTDRESLAEAQALLKNLRHFEKDKAIILVGNKVDLARKRQVTVEDGQRTAADNGADFIETSTMLNHKVDNLLVGILSKIRKQSASQAPARKAKDIRKSIKGLLGRIVSK